VVLVEEDGHNADDVVVVVVGLAEMDLGFCKILLVFVHFGTSLSPAYHLSP
jgi:hypothetical protein